MDRVNKVLQKRQSASKGKNIAPSYQPCVHEDSAMTHMCERGCDCVDRMGFCEKYCNCSLDCPYRFPGCSCKNGCQNKGSCVCLLAGRECDPDLCSSCGLDRWPITPTCNMPSKELQAGAGGAGSGAGAVALNPSVPAQASNGGLHNPDDAVVDWPHCHNFALQSAAHPKMYTGLLVLAQSNVAGWGLFTHCGLRPGDFVGEYKGEVISQNEAERRGKMYDHNFNSYLFNMNSEFTLDATRKGNKMRFVNHSETPNCTAKVCQVGGDHRIAIYAIQNIKPGSELFYNYRYSDDEKGRIKEDHQLKTK